MILTHRRDLHLEIRETWIAIILHAPSFSGKDSIRYNTLLLLIANMFGLARLNDFIINELILTTYLFPIPISFHITLSNREAQGVTNHDTIY